MIKTFYHMNDFVIENPMLINRIKNSRYFEVLNEYHDLYGNTHLVYKFTGYSQPLLALVSDTLSTVYSPYSYMGNYDYNGEKCITLHSTYGRMHNYRMLELFGVIFYVESSLSDEDVELSVMTSSSFTYSLIKCL